MYKISDACLRLRGLGHGARTKKGLLVIIELQQIRGEWYLAAPDYHKINVNLELQLFLPFVYSAVDFMN